MEERKIMDTTLYAAEPIAGALKAARVARGMTQRELATLAGVTQAHLAHIEAGKVDVRISSLTQLARSLGLEVVIVPRAVLPVVESLSRSSTRMPPPDSVTGRDLRRILNRVAALEQRAAEQPSLAATLRNIAASLQQLGSLSGLPWGAVRPLELELARLRRYKTLTAERVSRLADAVRQLRLAVAKRQSLQSEPREPQGAYSLEYAEEE